MPKISKSFTKKSKAKKATEKTKKPSKVIKKVATIEKKERHQLKFQKIIFLKILKNTCVINIKYISE